MPVVARRFDKFDPEEAFALMARIGVRNAFIPPTALRMLRSAPNPRGRHDIALRTIGSGGEALGAETLEWGTRGASASPSTSSTARPNAIWCCRLLRGDRRVAAGRDRQAGARATTSR